MAIINGDNNDNVLNGTVDDDTITGGPGNDTLNGLNGDDHYFYSRGDGDDTISEGVARGIDTLTFTDVDSTEVTITRSGAHLTIIFEESSLGAEDDGSVVLFSNGSSSLQTGVENINFADGVMWTQDDMQQEYLNGQFTDGDDNVSGFGGADTFIGGLGNDTLNGLAGNDSYFYTRGDGDDIIFDGSNQGVDTLTFTGVDSSDVSITRDGNNMTLVIAETSPGAGDGGSVQLILNAQLGFSRGVDSVVFADGITWTSADIRAQWLTAQFTDGDDDIEGFTGDENYTGGLGNDTLDGDSGNDSYFYTRGDGDDIIIEGANQGVDTLTFTGVDSTDVSITRDGNNMTLVIAESSPGAGDGGSVQLNFNAQLGFSRGVDSVVFADGITWTSADIRAQWLSLQFTDRDDDIIGFTGDENYTGGLGNDTLAGIQGDDSYFYTRGDGDDIIIEGANQGVDTLNFTGVESTDTSITRDGNNFTLVIAESAPGTGDAGSVQLNFNGQSGFDRGVDTIVFSDGVTYTSAELRVVYLDGLATPGDDVIDGLVGNDVLIGSEGDDQIMGGQGSDVYLYARGDGDDVITEVSSGGEDRLELEDISSTEFDVSIAGLGITLTFAESIPGAGDAGSIELLRGFSFAFQNGTERVLTSDGVFFTAEQLGNFRSDKLGTAAVDTLTGTAGTDFLSGLGGDDFIVGGQGNDFLRGGDGDDILNGGFGVDYLRGGAGADELIGFAGQDWADYITSSAAVTVDLLAGTGTGGDAEGDTFSFVERVYGSAFDDTITGDTNLNYLRGYLGDDVLNGGDGTDYLQGDAGADALDGGGGSDWAYYASATSGVTVNLGDSSLNTDEAIGDSYISIENLVGSRHNDNLTGDANANNVRGFLGDDTLQGGDGDDFIRGEAGADVHDGGAGNDWAYYVGSSAAITIDLGAGTSSGGEAEGDSFISIERVFGSRFADSITGDANANYLRGFFGNDTINGGDGNDFLQGDAGADTLNGGNGSDSAYYASSTVGITINLGDTSQNTGEALGDIYNSIENAVGSRFDDIIFGDSGDNMLRGFLGDDILNGGGGDDILRGEAGADTFVFEVGGGNDVVIDWADADDFLDLSSFGFADASAAMASAMQDDSNVVFTIGSDVITIEDTTLADITDNIII